MSLNKDIMAQIWRRADLGSPNYVSHLSQLVEALEREQMSKESSSAQSLKCMRLEYQLKVAHKALELACDDAWRGETQWPALYLKRAANAIAAGESRQDGEA